MWGLVGFRGVNISAHACVARGLPRMLFFFTFWRQSLLRGPGSHPLTRVADQPGPSMALPCQHWDNKCVAQHLACYVGAGNATPVFMLAYQHLTNLAIYLVPLPYFLKQGF